MLEIQLAARDSNWRLFMVRKADPAFVKYQEKIFKRDDYHCRYCGFAAKSHMEVVNIDQDYRHNNLQNLATACTFCAQCFFLEAVGKGEFGGGTLVYLPELAQHELNALCHVLFSSLLIGGSTAMQARNIYRDLRLRAQMVDKQVGEGLSNPGLYGRLLIEMANERTDRLHNQLTTKLRLLPDMVKFAKHVEDWLWAGFDSLIEHSDK